MIYEERQKSHDTRVARSRYNSLMHTGRHHSSKRLSRCSYVSFPDIKFSRQVSSSLAMSQDVRVSTIPTMSELVAQLFMACDLLLVVTWIFEGMLYDYDLHNSFIPSECLSLSGLRKSYNKINRKSSLNHPWQVRDTRQFKAPRRSGMSQMNSRALESVVLVKRNCAHNGWSKEPPDMNQARLSHASRRTVQITDEMPGARQGI